MGDLFSSALSAWPISIFRRFLRNLSAKLADRRLLTERRSVGPIARDIQGQTTIETRKEELIARDFFRFVPGVTDSKAVTGSKKSGLDLSSPSSSVVVVVTGVVCGVVFTALIVCLLVTCRQRKVC